MESLRPIFDGAEPVFVAESDQVGKLFEARDLEHLSIHEMIERRPPDVVLVVERLETMRALHKEMHEATDQSRVLLLPACSFDPSPEVVAYSLDLLAASDFERAVSRNRVWRQVLSRHPSPLVFRRPGSDAELTCHLLGDVRVHCATEVVLPRGEWEGPAGYFEVEMELFDAQARYFSLEGELVVDGLLAAKSSNMAADLEPLHDEANDLIRERGGPAGRLRAADNRIVAFEIGGDDITDRLARLTGEMYERAFLEFSIGTNSVSAPVDWSVNSILNEGLAGIHVAIGDGIGGAHIDFVSTGTSLVK